MIRHSCMGKWEWKWEMKQKLEMETRTSYSPPQYCVIRIQTVSLRRQKEYVYLERSKSALKQRILQSNGNTVICYLWVQGNVEMTSWLPTTQIWIHPLNQCPEPYEMFAITFLVTHTRNKSYMYILLSLLSVLHSAESPSPVLASWLDATTD